MHPMKEAALTETRRQFLTRGAQRPGKICKLTTELGLRPSSPFSLPDRKYSLNGVR